MIDDHMNGVAPTYLESQQNRIRYSEEQIAKYEYSRDHRDEVIAKVQEAIEFNEIMYSNVANYTTEELFLQLNQSLQKYCNFQLVSFDKVTGTYELTSFVKSDVKK